MTLIHPARMDTEALLERFEKDIRNETFQFDRRYKESDAKKELVLRGYAILPAIVAHLRKHLPWSERDQVLGVHIAFGMLLNDIAIEIGGIVFKRTPVQLADTTSWIEWVERIFVDDH